ncbi:hypothetical protein AYO38_08615 [bacterium SCGC AG-212-C10]|nr:hypothetical protein AYO38_08615 [bacterium SCGC AG-212-C10]
MANQPTGTYTGSNTGFSRSMDYDSEQPQDGQSMVSGAMTKVQDGVEGGKEKLADGIGSAAETMRERMDGDGAVAKAGTMAADSLEKTASYLRDHESGELWADVQEYVKQHPASALVGALAAGFVLSRIVR